MAGLCSATNLKEAAVLQLRNLSDIMPAYNCSLQLCSLQVANLQPTCNLQVANLQPNASSNCFVVE